MGIMTFCPTLSGLILQSKKEVIVMSSLLKETPNKPIAGLKFTARELCLCAIMSTIVFLMTFIPKIPIPLGYAHIGDAAIFLIVLLAPKRPALLAACIGSALADFIGGFYLWIMPTLFIKFIMAYIVYVIAKPDEDKFSFIKTGIAFVIASLWMTAGYVAFGALIYDSLAAGLASGYGLLVKSLVNIAAALLALPSLKKAIIIKL